jgi:16S rRNA C967 or C1407 C5-methylase (RsmB/RsmF family)
MDNLRSKSPITFRINTLIRHGIDYVLEKQIQENFSKSKIKIEKDQDVKYLYRVDSILKNKLLSNKYYREGFLIIQDKCSAAAVDILCPLKEDFILDMCAAPGIKTSFMALLTKNEGRILASEFETNRIHVMRSLLEKFNASNIFYINNDSTINIFREGFKFDKILIDAPCSGSGTFKNHPELKWRQNFNFLNQNLIIQEKLIRSALKLLKRDGILVYSVCSLYPEEGEMQVQKFSQFLIPLKLPLWLSPGYKINGKDVEGTGRCFPSIHGCEGFFISKFKKKE